MAEQEERPGRTRTARLCPAATSSHAARRRVERRGERRGALGLVRFHDGVCRTLTPSRSQRPYLTPRCFLRGRVHHPPPTTTTTGPSLPLTNPEQRWRNRTLLQLLAASSSKASPEYVIL